MTSLLEISVCRHCQPANPDSANAKTKPALTQGEPHLIDDRLVRIGFELAKKV